MELSDHFGPYLERGTGRDELSLS